MTSKLSYESAGVSLARGDAASADAFACMQATFNPSVVIDCGLPVINLLRAIKYMKEPRLHVTPDGVGTKLIYAAVCGIPETVGEDLVAMCTDDHSRYNVRPIAFTVYRGTNRIDEEIFAKVTQGAVRGCLKAGVPYISGETAEMPGFYIDPHYELVGASIGVYDTNLLRGQRIRFGDLLVALPSLGGGSNGFSLMRKLFPPQEVAAGRTTLTAKQILKPTPIYTAEVLAANKRFRSIRGWAHITGGGLGERGKLPSLMPEGFSAVLDQKSWKIPNIFRKIQSSGNVPDEQMRETFNMGLMMMVCPVEARQAMLLVRFFESINCQATIVGRVEERKEPGLRVVVQ